MRLSLSSVTSRESAYASDYSIAVGDDSSTWRTAVTAINLRSSLSLRIPAGGVGGTDVFSLDGASGRYIRIHIPPGMGPYLSYSLWEVLVHEFLDVPHGADSASNIWYPESLVTHVGCEGSYSSQTSNAINQDTEKWSCTKDGSPGFEVVPSHGKSSIAQKLRVYSANVCPGCDPVSFELQGRVTSSDPWVTISAGDLPWKDETTARNARGNPVSSTYLNADASLTSTEVSVNSDGVAYTDYKLTFPLTREEPSTLNIIQLSEVELVGLILEDPAYSLATADVSDVTASSEQSGSLSKYNMIDGNLSTRWASLNTDDQTIVLDLGEVKNLAGILLWW